MTKLEAIEKLSTHDHGFLTPKFAKEIAEVFGMTLKLSKYQDCRSEFKGLTLFGINPETKKEYQEGDWAEGIEAHRLANHIADHLKVNYPDFFGIGSQLRGTCEVLERFLKDS